VLSGGGTLSDTLQTTTQFTMSVSAATVKATYKAAKVKDTAEVSDEATIKDIDKVTDKYTENDNNNTGIKENIADVKASSIMIVGAPTKYVYKTAGSNTINITSKILPDAVAQGVRWSLSGPAKIEHADGSAVTIAFTGVEGVVRLIATASDDSNISASTVITVVRNVTAIATPIQSVYIQKGKSWKPSVVMYEGTAIVTGAKLTWESSNKNIATVDQNGKIKMNNGKKLKKGKAVITATAANSKVLRITVNYSKKAIKLITFSAHIKSEMKVGTQATIHLKFMPKKVPAVKITFNSNKKGLSIDKAGKVTATKKGTYKITVKIGNKKVVKKITVI
jgi:hypothetical protein